jgi:hypothetical protein
LFKLYNYTKNNLLLVSRATTLGFLEKSEIPEGVPILPNLWENKGKEVNEENMRTNANVLKGGLERYIKVLEKSPEEPESITDENKQSHASYIFNNVFKEEISLTSLGLFLMTVYICYKAAASDEIKNEFLHFCATYLHQTTKEWVNKHSSWVDAFVDTADEVAILNFIGLSKKQVATISTVAQIGAVAIGFFAVKKLSQYVFSDNSPAPM